MFIETITVHLVSPILWVGPELAETTFEICFNILDNILQNLHTFYLFDILYCCGGVRCIDGV